MGLQREWLGEEDADNRLTEKTDQTKNRQGKRRESIPSMGVLIQQEKAPAFPSQPPCPCLSRGAVEQTDRLATAASRHIMFSVATEGSDRSQQHYHSTSGSEDGINTLPNSVSNNLASYASNSNNTDVRKTPGGMAKPKEGRSPSKLGMASASAYNADAPSRGPFLRWRAELSGSSSKLGPDPEAEAATAALRFEAANSAQDQDPQSSESEGDIDEEAFMATRVEIGENLGMARVNLNLAKIAMARQKTARATPSPLPDTEGTLSQAEAAAPSPVGPRTGGRTSVLELISAYGQDHQFGTHVQSLIKELELEQSNKRQRWKRQEEQEALESEVRLAVRVENWDRQVRAINTIQQATRIFLARRRRRQVVQNSGGGSFARGSRPSMLELQRPAFVAAAAADSDSDASSSVNDNDTYYDSDAESGDDDDAPKHHIHARPRIPAMSCQSSRGSFLQSNRSFSRPRMRPLAELKATFIKKTRTLRNALGFINFAFELGRQKREREGRPAGPLQRLPFDPANPWGWGSGGVGGPEGGTGDGAGGGAGGRTRDTAGDGAGGSADETSGEVTIKHGRSGQVGGAPGTTENHAEGRGIQTGLPTTQQRLRPSLEVIPPEAGLSGEDIIILTPPSNRAGMPDAMMPREMGNFLGVYEDSSMEENADGAPYGAPSQLGAAGKDAMRYKPSASTTVLSKLSLGLFERVQPLPPKLHVTTVSDTFRKGWDESQSLPKFRYLPKPPKASPGNRSRSTVDWDNNDTLAASDSGSSSPTAAPPRLTAVDLGVDALLSLALQTSPTAASRGPWGHSVPLSSTASTPHLPSHLRRKSVVGLATPTPAGRLMNPTQTVTGPSDSPSSPQCRPALLSPSAAPQGAPFAATPNLNFSFSSSSSPPIPTGSGPMSGFPHHSLAPRVAPLPLPSSLLSMSYSVSAAMGHRGNAINDNDGGGGGAAGNGEFDSNSLHLPFSPLSTATGAALDPVSLGVGLKRGYTWTGKEPEASRGSASADVLCPSLPAASASAASAVSSILSVATSEAAHSAQALPDGGGAPESAATGTLLPGAVNPNSYTFVGSSSGTTGYVPASKTVSTWDAPASAAAAVAAAHASPFAEHAGAGSAPLTGEQLPLFSTGPSSRLPPPQHGSAQNANGSSLYQASMSGGGGSGYSTSTQSSPQLVLNNSLSFSNSTSPLSATLNSGKGFSRNSEPRPRMMSQSGVGPGAFVCMRIPAASGAAGLGPLVCMRAPPLSGAPGGASSGSSYHPPVVNSKLRCMQKVQMYANNRCLSTPMLPKLLSNLGGANLTSESLGKGTGLIASLSGSLATSDSIFLRDAYGRDPYFGDFDDEGEDDHDGDDEDNPFSTIFMAPAYPTSTGYGVQAAIWDENGAAIPPHNGFGRRSAENLLIGDRTMKRQVSEGKGRSSTLPVRVFARNSADGVYISPSAKGDGDTMANTNTARSGSLPLLATDGTNLSLTRCSQSIPHMPSIATGTGTGGQGQGGLLPSPAHLKRLSGSTGSMPEMRLLQRLHERDPLAAANAHDGGANSSVSAPDVAVLIPIRASGATGASAAAALLSASGSVSGKGFSTSPSKTAVAASGAHSSASSFSSLVTSGSLGPAHLSIVLPHPVPPSASASAGSAKVPSVDTRSNGTSSGSSPVGFPTRKGRSALLKRLVSKGEGGGEGEGGRPVNSLPNASSPAPVLGPFSALKTGSSKKGGAKKGDGGGEDKGGSNNNSDNNDNDNDNNRSTALATGSSSSWVRRKFFGAMRAL